MLRKHRIKEIYFVLSIDNKIVSEALKANEFSDIGALHTFYKDIKRVKKRRKIALNKNDGQFIMLSFYLNKKIKELENQLKNLSEQSIKIRAKIYHRDQDKFTNIYSDLIYLEEHQLN